MKLLGHLLVALYGSFSLSRESDPAAAAAAASNHTIISVRPGTALRLGTNADRNSLMKFRP